MNRLRLFILIMCIVCVAGLSTWIIANAVQQKRSMYPLGKPTEDVKKNLQPKIMALSQLRPPALRASDPIRFGSVTSTASVILFGDFDNPTCRDAEAAIKRILPQFGGTIRYMWRDLPIAEHNQRAFETAMIVRCAGLQNKYWETHDKLLAYQKPDEYEYDTVATALRLDKTALAQCRNNAQMRGMLQQDIDESRNDGVNSTPVLFIGATAHTWPMTDLEIQKAIRDFLAS